MIAQAMLEKGALDGLSAGLTQVRFLARDLANDDRTFIVIGLIVILVFGWRMIR